MWKSPSVQQTPLRVSHHDVLRAHGGEIGGVGRVSHEVGQTDVMVQPAPIRR